MNSANDTPGELAASLQIQQCNIWDVTVSFFGVNDREAFERELEAFAIRCNESYGILEDPIADMEWGEGE